MERICSVPAAVIDGKKRVEGSLTVFEDRCEFAGVGVRRMLRWADLAKVKAETQLISLPGFLFTRKSPALRLSAEDGSLTLVMAEDKARQVIRDLQDRQEQLRRQRDAAPQVEKPREAAPQRQDEVPPGPEAIHTNMFTHDGIELSQEQAYAYRLAEGSRLNLFITGKAGTGKSVILRYFRRHTQKRVAVLAPTGIAAINVGGQTIHSFFHLKPEPLVDFNVNQLRGFNKLADKISFFDTIVIDEISMVRADTLDAMDAILRKARRRPDELFGGCQMIFVGDLYQLPPVVTDEDKEVYGKKYATPFFFGSRAVTFDSFNLIELTQVYRQRDGAFIDTLNLIREGEAPESSLQLLNGRARVQAPEDESITLTLHRAAAHQINAEKLAALPGPSRTYRAEIRGDFLATETEADGKKPPEPPVEQELELRVGAKIIMMVNDRDRRWVNGTMGFIQSLSENEIRVRIGEDVYSVNKFTWSKYRYEYNRVINQLIQYEVGSYTQYPIALAYAITIHKSQGQTYDQVKIDFADRNAFAEGQTYVALSRCRSLQGLYLSQPIERRDVIVSQDVKQWMAEFSRIMAERRLPAFDDALPAEAAETEGVTVERIPDRPFEWTEDGRIRTRIPMSPKKITGTRFAKLLVPDRFSSPFQTWCEIMRVYEKPYEDNRFTLAGKAIQPIQTEYVRHQEHTLDVAAPEDVYGDSPEEQQGYDFFPDNDMFGGMWDAVGRTAQGDIARVYEMKTTGSRNFDFWDREKFSVPMDKLLQGALYAHLLGLDEVTMVSSSLQPGDYDAPERYVCSTGNTRIRNVRLSEISDSFETEYVGKARSWWNDHVATGLSPQFDRVKDREILQALERMVPRPDPAASMVDDSVGRSRI